MADQQLPPPPINDKPGSFTWLEWYRQLRNYVTTSGSVPWYIINFAGSNITDIATRRHNDLQSVQGGTAGERYHLTAQQHASMSNALEIRDTTSGIVLPTTPTVFKPATTVSATGITYNSSTGEIVFTNGGTYTFELFLNAQASASNKTVCFYGEIDTGSGYAIRRYSGRTSLLKTSSQEQISFTSANYWPTGSKLKIYLWSDSATVTLNSVDIPGTTPGTVTVPASRLLLAGSL